MCISPSGIEESGNNEANGRNDHDKSFAKTIERELTHGEFWKLNAVPTLVLYHHLKKCQRQYIMQAYREPPHTRTREDGAEKKEAL